MASPAAPIASSPREIRVFISSTFRDMQEEREELVKQIAGCPEPGQLFLPAGRTCCDRDSAMYVAFHSPMFGTAHVDSHPLECPFCPRGKEKGQNDWEARNINVCNPGDVYTCLQCGRSVTINWGLVEPDHLSNWVNSEYCPHRLCKIKYQELCLERGWRNADI